MAKRLAVLVGCNYANTPNELHGCINDVVAMREVLVKRFGFKRSNIELLTDAADSPVMPTGSNIKRALGKMVEMAEAGDVLYFHYSGHGTRIPSGRTRYRKDEAIVPCDFNLITDVDFRLLVNRLPKGTSFTMVSDSCHSGGLIDKEKEQIGPSTASDRASRSSVVGVAKPRVIPFESVVQHLSSLSSAGPSEDLATHLAACFGDEASPRFSLRQLELHLSRRLGSDDGILLSGCQANETSADVQSEGAGGKPCGAFSNALQEVLSDHPAPLSNRELVMGVRKILRAEGFEQHPCLYCSDQNADAAFLLQQP